MICLHDGRGKDRAPKRMIDALDKTIPIWLEEGLSVSADRMRGAGNEQQWKVVLKNGGFFILLIIITAYIVFKGQ